MAAKESALKFVVFLGTVRENNYGQRAAKFIVKKLTERGHDTTLLGELGAVRWEVSTHPSASARLRTPAAATLSA